MERYEHNRLVRDRLPEIIETTGNQCEFRIMEKEEFEKELRRKLIEEATELLEVPEESLPKELADVLEVIKSIAEFYGINFELIEKKQAERRRERGGFQKRIFLVWSTQPKGK